jgi:hypothetical protein
MESTHVEIMVIIIAQNIRVFAYVDVKASESHNFQMALVFVDVHYAVALNECTDFDFKSF